MISKILKVLRDHGRHIGSPGFAAEYGIREEDYKDVAESLVKLFTMPLVCPNCKKGMKLYGVVYECNCGVVKTIR